MMARISPEVRRLLHEGEAVVWAGRPDAAVWTLAKFIGLFFILAAFVAVGVMFLLTPSRFVGLGVFGLGLVVVVLVAALELWWLRHLVYVFTPKRIILQRGLIGRDFEIVDFARVTDYSVRVSVWDKIMGRGTGTIRIRTASEGGATSPYSGGPYSKRVMHNVPGPYDVQSTMLRLRDEARGRLSGDGS